MNNYATYVGKILDGRYKILELLGTGGMAVVLKAEDLVMKRLVAIKILNDEYNDDELAEHRFINESKAVAMLSHKNIVSIYDVAIYNDIKYIVMEFLDGITLKDYLDQKGALSWKEACFYVAQILKALEHSHSRGVIHRDIKPQNVMLQKNGEIRLTDFGIAQIPNCDTLNMTDKAIGTVYYISPEQAKGEATNCYSDIYSVGVVLYEAVTGALPFVAETPVDVAKMQVNNMPAPPSSVKSGIPSGLDTIILKAMAKKPADRFASAHSMLKAIELLIRNPDVRFTTSAEAGDAPLKKNTVIIDMINTEESLEQSLSEIMGEGGASKTMSKEEKKRLKLENKKIKKRNSFLAPRSNSMFPIITGVTLAFLIVFAYVLFAVGKELIWPKLMGEEKNGTEFIIPNLIGQEWKDVKNTLLEGEYVGAENIKITVKEITWEDNEKGVGEIFYQSPTGGIPGKLPEGQEYFVINTLKISKGTSTLTVPDVLYQTVSEARALLENLELEVTAERRASSTSMAEQVIGISPEVGQIVKKGDTVTIYFTEADQRNVYMPKLVDLNIEEAIQLLEDYNLGQAVITLSETFTAAPGIVMTQSVPQYTLVPPGTVVELVVSSQPATTPMGNYVGMDEQTALINLTSAGFVIGDVIYVNSVDSDGIVLEQSILPGTPVKSGASVVIKVSKRVTMPSATA